MAERWFSRRGAARAVAPDDGPRDRGDRRRRPRARAGAVRGDEARVADAARPDGHGIAGAMSFIKERLGEDGVAEAQRGSMARLLAAARSRRSTPIDRREVVELLAATWRAHSTSAASGANPGAFTITEDDEKVTFAMNPCGSGQRLWRNGRYEGDDAYARDRRGARLELRPQGLPDLLHALHVHERVAPDPLDRASRSTRATRPTTSTTIPCIWYWYKDPADDPGRALGALRAREAGVVRALVTGAGGRHRPRDRRRARRRSGAHGRRRADLRRAAAPTSTFDLRDPEAVRAGRRAARSSSSAGSTPWSPTPASSTRSTAPSAFSADEWRKDLETNLTGAVQRRPGGVRAAARGRRRPRDRVRLVGRRPSSALPGPGRLRGREGGARRHGPHARGRVGAARHPRQRRDARPDRHPEGHGPAGRRCSRRSPPTIPLARPGEPKRGRQTRSPFSSARRRATSPARFSGVNGGAGAHCRDGTPRNQPGG